MTFPLFMQFQKQQVSKYVYDNFSLRPTYRLPIEVANRSPTVGRLLAVSRPKLWPETLTKAVSRQTANNQLTDGRHYLSGTVLHFYPFKSSFGQHNFQLPTGQNRLPTSRPLSANWWLTVGQNLGLKHNESCRLTVGQQLANSQLAISLGTCFSLLSFQELIWSAQLLVQN